jgi:hypothetical protein
LFLYFSFCASWPFAFSGKDAGSSCGGGGHGCGARLCNSRLAGQASFRAFLRGHVSKEQPAR